MSGAIEHNVGLVDPLIPLGVAHQQTEWSLAALGSYVSLEQSRPADLNHAGVELQALD